MNGKNDDKTFDERAIKSPGGEGTPGCQRWEAAIADLMDGALDPEAETGLRAHAAGCPECAGLLQEAFNGREWVRMLHAAPSEVPAALLERILAQTSERPQGTLPHPGPSSAAVYGEYGEIAAATIVYGGPSMVLPGVWMPRGQRQARLLMTTAMAVFSIALTLSITGVRPGNLHAAVAAPGQLQASASRQFFDTKKQVVSFYDNLRVVREMEANVHDALQDMSTQNAARQGGAREGASTKSGPDRTVPSAQRTSPPSLGGAALTGPKTLLVAAPSQDQPPRSRPT